MLWGHRVVVPEKGRKRALQMLHEGHPGIVWMKTFSRGYVWWPGIDEQIENTVKECTECQMTGKMPPPVPLHPSLATNNTQMKRLIPKKKPKPNISIVVISPW